MITTTAFKVIKKAIPEARSKGSWLICRFGEHVYRVIVFERSSIVGQKYCWLFDRPLFREANSRSLEYGDRLAHSAGGDPYLWGDQCKPEHCEVIVETATKRPYDFEQLQDVFSKFDVSSSTNFRFLLDSAILSYFQSDHLSCSISLTRGLALPVFAEWQFSIQQRMLELLEILEQRPPEDAKVQFDRWVSAIENSTRTQFASMLGLGRL